MKTASEFLKEYCNLSEETTEIEVNASDVIRAMIDYAHQQNDNVSQIVPSELRINEKAGELNPISDDDFDESGFGEFDDYVMRRKIKRQSFVDGANWMRKMLILK